MNKNIALFTLFSLTLHTTLIATDTQPLQSWRVYTNNMPTTPTAHLRAFRSSSAERLEGLSYINILRTGANLVPYNANSLLDTAAQNHMNYLLEQQTFSHFETNSSSTYFTGQNAGDRLSATGYSWSSYGENLSSGNTDIVESIDGLFSAIYHRFGFLDLLNNEIGIGSANSVIFGNMYGYNTANTAWWQTRSQNPSYVVWPHDNYQRALTSFNNYEAPDPLPKCPAGGISGNPISIEFNPDKTDSVSLESFKLFRSDGSEVTNTKILSANNDPNNFLRPEQFVLFPMTSLSLDSRYHVEFLYRESGTSKHIAWNFTTRNYHTKRYDVYQGRTYDLISQETYLLHLKPNSCTTFLRGYSWNNGSSVIERLSSDLFRISITEDTTIDFGDFHFSLRVASSDTAITPSSSSRDRNVKTAMSIIHFLLSSN